MNLQHTTYLPLEQKWIDTSLIVPTENDMFWRKQLLKGYVHDPSAAMYGGVAGNAGLFANALDMAALFQMLLNKGSYGGVTYFQESTVLKFTQTQQGAGRGLGFNKKAVAYSSGIAEDAPYSTYGHTGFTGNSIWVDPENELIFVFLSNRVYPKADNKKIIYQGTRKRIHQVIYNELNRIRMNKDKQITPNSN